MQSALYHQRDQWRRYAGIALAAVWISGLLFGASAARLSERCIHFFVQHFPLMPLSFTDLFVRVLCSMSLTITAVILSKPAFFLIAALFRAFFLSYWLECLFFTGNEAAVLLYWLLSPGGAFSAALLLHFWTVNICEFRSGFLRHLLLCFGAQFSTGIIQLLCGCTFY